MNFCVRGLCPSPVYPCHHWKFIGSESFAAKPLPWEVMGLDLKIAVILASEQDVASVELWELSDGSSCRVGTGLALLDLPS